MSQQPRQHRNELHVIGRVTTPPYERELPSGDVVRSWRVTVDRADDPGRHDVISCTAWTARIQRTVAGWEKGDVVEVSGALRSRFWRTPGGVSSAADVDVRTARRVSAAVRPRKP